MFVLVQVCVLEPAAAATAAALGESFRAQRELTLAEQAFEKAREIQPRADVYDALLGKLHNLQSRADPAHAEVWLERSDRALSAALSKNRAAGEHVVNLALIRGQRAQRAGGAARAELSASVVQLYRRALRLNPQDPVLLRNWATTQVNLLQDTQGALASVQRALALEPRNAALHGLLGDIQLKRALAQEGEARRGVYLSAASAYQRARELAPREAAYQVNEGKAYLGAGERDKAIASLRAALRVVPATSRTGQAVASLLQRAEGGEP
jgi:tetratricopeptide (TPR) repeat protein